MQKVLISSCLLGEAVRYDGTSAEHESKILEKWIAEGRVVPVCPELRGGLGVPRRPAEIIGVGGFAVLDGFAAVLDDGGSEITRHLIAGAHDVLQVALTHGAQIAVLKDGSPSCGRTYIHNGQFRGVRKRGEAGVTAALLQRNGVAVFSEHQMEDAEMRLKDLESSARVRRSACETGV